MALWRWLFGAGPLAFALWCASGDGPLACLRLRRTHVVFRAYLADRLTQVRQTFEVICQIREQVRGAREVITGPGGPSGIWRGVGDVGNVLLMLPRGAGHYLAMRW